MKKFLVLPAAVILAAGIALVGCQTAKPAPAEPSAIRVEESGFAPQGGAEHASLTMELLFGNGASIKSWTASVVGQDGAVKSWAGSSSFLPASLSWNGTANDGTDAPEGIYTARLSIEYEKGYQPVSEESRNFILDRTPPTGAVTLNPSQFVPADQGVSGPVTFRIGALSKVATLSGWTLEIYDAAGGLVRSFDGEWPNDTATWDGSSLAGGFVAPATTYKAVATVRDVFGLSSALKADVPVAEIPLATEQNQVRAMAAGFSPVSATAARTIDFALMFGNVDSLKTWKLTVQHAAAGAPRSWTGDATNLPRTVSWDGKTASGVMAPEGAYAATLSIDYGKSYQPVLVRSASFLLDVTPPSGNVSASPVKLAADGKGGIQPVTFTLYGNPTAAALKSWTLNILDAGGKSVAGFQGDWPAPTPSWDGSLSGGGRADPTKSYTFVMRLQDVYGNTGEARGSLVTGELPMVTAVPSVSPGARGFSPNGDQVADVMPIALSYGQPSAVSAWKLAIGAPGAATVKTFTGDAGNLPSSVNWDGNTDQGALAPDSSYSATLSVNYGTVFASAAVTSTPFSLVTAPPAGTITLSDLLFSPIEAASTITLTINATAKNAAIDSWSMVINDPAGNAFRTFSGKWPLNSVTWDGKGANGDLVQSAEEYPLVVRVRDEFGNVGVLNAVVPVDILVEKTATGYRILASRIFFKAFTADYTDVAPDLAKQNAERLDALARKLSKFAGYKIRLVGHAVSIYWDNAALGKAEQRDVLIPLSTARAEAVMKALIERGLDASRFTTDGVGASDQLVPDSDYTNRWQNRRVALFLDK